MKSSRSEQYIALHLVVRGRVQGVWYRASTVEKAQELGLTGWVRNQSDGSVEILAQGQRTAVGHLQAWCHQGPPSAHVHEVQAQERAPEALVDFQVRP